MVDLWIGQENSGVRDRCSIFEIFLNLLRVEVFFYFFIFSDVGKVANKQHKTKPLLSCFRVNDDTYGFYARTH